MSDFWMKLSKIKLPHKKIFSPFFERAVSDDNLMQAVELFSISPKQRANYMCKNNEITRYASIGGYLLANPGKETQFVPSYDPNECAKACDRNELFEWYRMVS